MTTICFFHNNSNDLSCHQSSILETTTTTTTSYSTDDSVLLLLQQLPTTTSRWKSSCSSSFSSSSSFAVAAETIEQQQQQQQQHDSESQQYPSRLRNRIVVPSKPIGTNNYSPAGNIRHVAAEQQQQQQHTSTTTTTTTTNLSLHQILYRAASRGLGGGIPGAIAGALQVLLLMWLRTIINYQCRYGTTFGAALRTLLMDGGIPRLYRGVSFALVQAPLARFVSTAANDGMQALLAQFTLTAAWGPGRTTVMASIVVGGWRMMLMPIDTMKTVLQVDSFEGFRSLMRRVKAGRIGVLYAGAIANAVSAILGHYPWFYTYNSLSTSDTVRQLIPSPLLRSAGVGVLASVVSDTVVNAVRVIKTTKQSLSTKQTASYAETVKIILAADGWKGLFGRGLRTRIFANALQSLVFTVVWRGLADRWQRKKGDEESDSVGTTSTN